MIKGWLINWLNKGTLKNASKVELSIGIVYLRPLTNGILNEVKRKSTIAGTIMNDSYFFEFMDYKLTRLSRKQIQNLSVYDGNKLRIAVKELLKQNGVIKIEGSKDADKLTVEEVEKLAQQKKDVDSELDKYYQVAVEQKRAEANGR